MIGPDPILKSCRRYLHQTGAFVVGAVTFPALFKAVPVVASVSPCVAWEQTTKGDLTDLEYVVLCGRLAAQAHNTRPRAFNRIVLYADPRRCLMLMGLGCATENMVVAVAQNWVTRRLCPMRRRMRFFRTGAAFVANDAAYCDLMSWFRRSRWEWEASRDGICIFASDAPWFVKEWVEFLASPANLVSSEFRQGEIDVVERLADVTPVWSERDTPDVWFRGGRLIDRIYPAAAAQGLADHPLAHSTESPVGSSGLARSLGLWSVPCAGHFNRYFVDQWSQKQAVSC